uniref:Peptidase A2 domain-containing protein n=1 Tax=Cacopsylla melanoneura TaxID=428564 RepID=A0A8D9BRV9_9HEMI
MRGTKKGTCLFTSPIDPSPKTLSCSFCKGTHLIFNCESFKSLPIAERVTKAQTLRLCNNCLSPHHKKGTCKSRFSCSKCKKRHHTLLHKNFSPNSKGNTSSETVPEEPPQSSVSSAYLSSQRTKTVFLATALVILYDADGKAQKFRALLDKGSESNFISEHACQRLKLKKFKSNMSLAGIGGASLKASHFTNASVHSCHTSYSLNLDFIVLPKLTQNLPSHTVNISKLTCHITGS